MVTKTAQLKQFFEAGDLTKAMKIFKTFKIWSNKGTEKNS